MEDTVSLGGRSSSVDVVSNASTALLSESDTSPGDGCGVDGIEKREEVERSEDHRGGTPEDQRGGTPEDQRGGTPEDQRGGTPEDQRGGTPEDQRGGTPEDQRGGTPEDHRGGTPQDQRGSPLQDGRESTPDQRGAASQEQRGRTPQDQRGRTPQDQRGETPQDQRGGTPHDQRGETPHDQRGETPQDQRGETPQDQRGETPQDQRGETPQDQREETPQDQREETPQDQREETPQDQREETPQDQREATPTDQTTGGDATSRHESVSPDAKPEDRSSTQNSFTDEDRNIESQQGELIQDRVSGKQSPEEGLSLSRQSQFENATSENNEVQDIDVRSTDRMSLNTTGSQRHTSTGSVTGCCCNKTDGPTKDETDADNNKVEIAATPPGPETAESVASLERGNDSRATNRTEPRLEEAGGSVCGTQSKNEDLGGQERKVLEQCCQRVAEENLNPQSPDEGNQLKAEIISLQARLETLIKDNNEKGMRIVALESNLLEMTAKLVTVEKKCLPLESSPSRRGESSKSRTCAIL